MPQPKRIALMGFSLEANGFAPVTVKADFVNQIYLAGDELAADLAKPAPRAPGTMIGFMRAMTTAGPWTPVPIVMAGSPPGGPVEQAFFQEILDAMERGLKAALPLDGVFLAEHGAGTATGDHDPDGTVFALVRSIVGPKVPVISTLDLHANVSQRMVDNTDALIAFITNPHVDMIERGAEAAALMLEMFAGTRLAADMLRMPMIPPSVTMGTASGPYADLINYGQTKLSRDIANVSVCAGFSLGDTPLNGMTVTVTARGDKAKATALARDIAGRAWADRKRYVPKMVSLEEATAMALACSRDPSKPSVLFADPADNPGGGGRGNTTYILDAFHKAGVTGCLLGMMVDPPLVEDAIKLGVGAKFIARFNRDRPHEFSLPFTADARVIAIGKGSYVGRRGVHQGRTTNLGATALIEVGGIKIVVISLRQQCADPMAFEQFGLAIAAARSVIVKSRGHFRAGFDEVFTNDRIHEVDVPGLTTPRLERLAYKRAPRPIFPLDKDFEWQVPAD
ncbi:MAG: M81 family metallopeptidase [Alphaproteobacteria bacterium]|nr:M81 family metallopeptidase [Alphaproteobacteria bacterium]